MYKPKSKQGFMGIVGGSDPNECGTVYLTPRSRIRAVERTPGQIEIEHFSFGWRAVDDRNLAESLCLTGGQKVRNFFQKHAPHLLEKEKNENER